MGLASRLGRMQWLKSCFYPLWVDIPIRIWQRRLDSCLTDIDYPRAIAFQYMCNHVEERTQFEAIRQTLSPCSAVNLIQESITR